MSRTAAVEIISRAINSFPLHEMPKLVVPRFPNMSWNKVKEILTQSKLKRDKQSIRKILMDSIKDLDTPGLRNLYLDLFLHAVAHHSDRKQWQVYRMKKDSADADRVPNIDKIDWNQVHRNVVQQCRVNNADSCVAVLKHDAFVWIGISQKNVVKNKGIVFRRPVVFAVSPPSSYLYVSGTVTPTFFKVVAKALNYKKCKIHPLSGRSLTSLRTILLQKESNTSNEDLNATKYSIEEPRNSLSGTDYTQHENRKQFADTTFKEELVIDKLVIDAKTAIYKGDAAPKLKGKNVPFTLTFKGRNLSKTMKQLTEADGLNLTRSPDYLHRTFVTGQNTFAINNEN